MLWAYRLSIKLVYKVFWNEMNCQIFHSIKVKYKAIWTIFLFLENLNKKVSYTNMKQNQLLK